MNARQLRHLAAALAHDVRNPLNAMAIHVELIEGRLKRDGAPDKAQLRKSTAVMAGEIERVDALLDEYLRFAGPEPERRPVDAALLLAEAVERARVEAKPRGVSLELSNGALGRWAVDAEGLSEALDAVLANAVQASSRGGVVRVSAAGDGNEGTVSIADGGDGIAAEDLPRVFALGFSRRGRAGVGLTIAKQIIRGHGGSLTVESGGTGRGAQLTLRVPIEVD